MSHTLNSDIRNRVIKVNNRAIFEMEYAGEMALALHKSMMYTNEFMDNKYRLSINDGNSSEKMQYAAERAEDTVRSQIGRFKHYLSLSLENVKLDVAPVDSQDVAKSKTPNQDIQANLESLKKKFAMYEALTTRLFRLTDESYPDGDELLSITIEPFFKSNLMPMVEKVRASAHQKMNMENDRLQAELTFSENIILAVSLLAFIMALALGYMIYRSIARPLTKLTASTKRLGEGELSERIDIQSNDELGMLADAFNRMAENLSHTTVSKDYFDNIIQSMGDALIVTDSKAYISKVNRATLNLLGYSEDELIDKPLEMVFSRDEEDVVGKVTHCYKSTDIDSYEATYVTKSGKKIPVSLSRSVMWGHNGNIKGMVCLAMDITEQKEAEEKIRKSLKEKEVLLGEIHHRVKNNLAVISSLLQMQIFNTENEIAQNVLLDSQLRIQSIALIHEKLYQSDTLAFIEYDKYIRQLLDTIETTFANDNKEVEIKTNLSDASLNINQAIPCALLINEVVVNSYKHAFRDRENGTIEVDMEQDKGQFILKIKDDGIGFPDDFDIAQTSSLGMTLVQTLSKQLEAEWTFESPDEGGTEFRMNFKVE